MTNSILQTTGKALITLATYLDKLPNRREEDSDIWVVIGLLTLLYAEIRE